MGADTAPHNQSSPFSVDDQGKLRVELKPGAPLLPSRPEVLRQHIEKAGYGAYFLFPEVLKKLDALQRSATEPVTVEIGERRDGAVSVSVTKDHMQASVTVMPAYGGQPVSKDAVRAALRRENVVYGIDLRAVNEAVAKASGEPLVVARGVPAEHGQDTQFESKVRHVSGRKPRLREDGSVDHHELGQFVTVKPGDLLMVKVAPTPGRNGSDVFGQIIPARPGAEKDFTPGLAGVEIDPDNPNRLLAAVAGRPVEVDGGVWVDQSLTIKQVDISTGNVRFDGDVTISGDVAAGMKIIVTGNVEIGGTVEAAVIEAGGNIVVKQGVIGLGDVRDEEGKLSETAAILKAGQNIHARFLTNVFATAAEAINIDDMVAHSEVTAKKRIVVGGPTSKKGHIIGGRIRAADFIEAQVVGSPAGAKTFIEVGVDPHLLDEYNEVMKRLQIKTDEHAKLQRLKEQLRANPRPDLEEKLVRAEAKLEQQLADASEKFAALQEKVEAAQEASLAVHKKLLPGVQVYCNGRIDVVSEERGPGRFVVKANGLVYEAPT